MSHSQLTRQAVEHEVGEQEAHNRQRPDNEHDPPWGEVVLTDAIEHVSPVPESSDPNLLGPLDDARTQHPDLRRSTGFLTKVEAEEAERCRRRNGV